jgi:DNA replication protein DnaC
MTDDFNLTPHFKFSELAGTSNEKYRLLNLDEAQKHMGKMYMLAGFAERVREIIGKPVIITTNLTLDEIKAPKDMRLQRIYDRITAMCIPVKFSGESLREDQGKQMREEARGILYGGA